MEQVCVLLWLENEREGRRERERERRGEREDVEGERLESNLDG